MFQRLNYGVIFRQTDEIFIARDFWYHTFEMDVPDSVSLPNLPFCNPSNAKCSMLTHVITQLKAARSGTVAQLNATLRSTEELVPQTQSYT